VRMYVAANEFCVKGGQVHHYKIVGEMHVCVVNTFVNRESVESPKNF
jgi:hypothetical protein